jgi:hypothetical protein
MLYEKLANLYYGHVKYMCKHVDECLLHEISNLEWVNCVLKWIKKCKCESICVEVLIYIYI